MDRQDEILGLWQKVKSVSQPSEKSPEDQIRKRNEFCHP